MKHINVPVDDETHEALAEIKGERTWGEALLDEFGVDE